MSRVSVVCKRRRERREKRLLVLFFGEDALVVEWQELVAISNIELVLELDPATNQPTNQPTNQSINQLVIKTKDELMRTIPMQSKRM